MTENIFNNKYFKLFKNTNETTGDWFIYSSEPEKVVILPYHYDSETKTLKLVTLIEPIFIWGRKKELVCVTGTIEPNEKHEDAASRELFEETGISQLNKASWTYVGGFNFNKSSTSKRHFYLVNIYGATVEKKTTDGSVFERNTTQELIPISAVQLSTDLNLHFLTQTLKNRIHEQTKSA